MPYLDLDSADAQPHAVDELVVRAAQKHGLGLNVCGEMSGEPIYTMLLLGMGLRQLSVTPHNIPEVKKLIRSATESGEEIQCFTGEQRARIYILSYMTGLRRKEIGHLGHRPARGTP